MEMFFRMKYYLLLLSYLLLSACAIFGGGNTLGNLDDDGSLLHDIDMPVVMHDEVRNQYTDILKDVDDAELKQQIKRRIAGVDMLQGDYKSLKGDKAPPKGYYAKAIKSYEKLLKEYPDAAENSTALYQVSKAYELSGQTKKALQALNKLVTKYPGFSEIVEAQFRIGELQFNLGQYYPAEKAYTQVINKSENAYTNSAYYMRGWSLYKQSLYDDSLEDFSKVLTRLMPKSGDTSQLSKSNQTLVKDTMHAMSLGFSHAGGAAKITKMYKRKSDLQYTWMLYDGLGGLYLSKERFEDSAESYREFVKQYPNSKERPKIHAQLINAYVQGGFIKQVLPEKEGYVKNYGIYSDYWQQATQKEQQFITPSLKKYIKELATHYHAEGQKLKSDVQHVSSVEVSKTHKKYTLAKQQAFNQAAHYYKEYMATFPKDKTIPQMVFMQSEAYFDGGQFDLAILGYEKTAYDYKDKIKGADAGYASIMAYIEQGKLFEDKYGEKSKRLKDWREKTVDSQLRFAQTFKSDKRSSAVLTKAAEELIALKEYQRAMVAAQSIVNQKKGVETKLKRSAYGIIARCQFELALYSDAEQSYKTQLTFIGKKSKDFALVKERIAITIYKQGELAVKEGNKPLAIQQFLRLKVEAAQSTVRVSAQYDAATYLLQLNQIKEAIVELKELKSKFPNHTLAPEFPRKLAYAYGENKQYKRAANEYMALHWNDKIPDVRRDALFFAAEFFEKNGDTNTAIDHYKRWAKTFEQPFDTRMEARYKLAYLYKKKNDLNRHLFWLRRIIAGDKNAADQRTIRSMWLGAWANAEYGDYWRIEFNRTRLKLPLNNSLAKKNERLKNATDRYSQAAAYNILEFVTRASYSTADIYNQFSQALMNSPRPRGLKPLELEQYELLLEDEALPFEDLAIDLFQGNIDRAWEKSEFNEWIEKSYAAMASIMPARFGKKEQLITYGEGIK